MAWGARSGVDDLLQRLREPKTGKNLCVLSFRKLSEDDVLKLAGAIATNSILEELYLSGHQLSAAGVQAFADALAANKTLQHLSIGHESLGDASVAVLCEGLTRNAQLAVKNWDLEYKALGVAGAQAISKLLETNTSLTELNLARNALGNDGVKSLVDGLQRNAHSALTTLSLVETQITGDALRHLATLLAQPHCALTTLQLSFNALDSASDAFFTALGTNTSLQQLFLKDTKLTDAHVVALAQALKTNATLEYVDLSDNGLSPIASVALADALQTNASLKRLVLGGNKGGDAGARALGDVLRASNTTLETLDLAQNELTHEGVASLLAAAKLKTLRLFHNKLAGGLPLVLPVLAANSALESLDVGANALHGELSVQLFASLHAHKSLTTLEMGGNSLGDHGHAALEALRLANPMLDVAADKNAQNEDGSVDGEQS